MQPVGRDSPCILGFSSSSSKSGLQTAGEAAIEPGWRKPGDGIISFCLGLSLVERTIAL